MARRFVPLGIALLALGAALVVVLAWRPAPSTVGTPADTGSGRVGELELARLDGGTVVIGRPGGGPILVNFWASWCPPCREEFPVLARAAEAGIAVVGVVRNDRPDLAAAFADEMGATWPMVLDPDGRAWAALGGAGLPTSVLLSDDGSVLETFFGPITDGDVERLSAVLMGGRSSG